jgi:putative polyhydroxyalkanoate system protein
MRMLEICSSNYRRNVAHARLAVIEKTSNAIEENPMPSIDIRRKHHHSLKEAKAAVKDTAAAIGKKFGIQSQWSGNTLSFERPGASGKIHVTAHEIHVTAQLGFLLGALKPMIEKEIEKQLDAGLA